MRSSITSLLFLVAALAGCAEPMDMDMGDPDGGIPNVTGRVAVHTQTTGLPALLSTATLSLGSLEAHSDREPSSAARVTLTAPLGLRGPTQTEIPAAPPATYGAVRFVALDALTLTTTTGNTLTIDFADVPPIELRCAGPGRYLTLGGVIDLDVSLDFASVQSVLTSGGVYPPLLPTQIVTDPTLVQDVLDALESALTVDCGR